MDEETKKSESANELEELKIKANEYLNNWKRSAADFINYKKDEVERMTFLTKYAKEDVIHNILPIFDSFYLSQKHSDILENVGMTEWQKGFTQIENQISEFLKKEEIEEIITAGEKFDPSTMEAMDEANSEEQMASGMVVEELQKGYKMDGKVLRPARVKISK